MVLAIVPAAPPTTKNQRATSWPAPISAMVPYLLLSRLRASAFCLVLVGRASMPGIVRERSLLCNGARRFEACRQSPGGVGEFPPRTTPRRIRLGHSGPPRDVGWRRWEAPQKIRARGGNPPTPPGALAP